MYLGELAPKNLRGALGIVPQLFITIGILCAQVLGIRQILGNNTGTIIPPSLVRVRMLVLFQQPSYDLKNNVASPSAFRLASHAGIDWHPCCN